MLKLIGQNGPLGHSDLQVTLGEIVSSLLRANWGTCANEISIDPSIRLFINVPLPPTDPQSLHYTGLRGALQVD